jgi:hypothetical protein
MIRKAHTTADPLEQHLEALHTASRLTSYFRRKHQPMATDVTPDAVITALHGAGVRCVLMGTHGLNVYRDQPRATQDVDVLVRKKDIPKAIRVLKEAFPDLTFNDTPVVARFADPATGQVALDVMKPTQKVYQMVFRHSVPMGTTHAIPSLEMALISKFAALTSPHRERLRKMQDATDFAVMTEHNKDHIDRAKLRRLAEQVYPGGSGEIQQLIEDILAGRPLQV